MKVIEENGKLYTIDEDSGLVVEAKEAEQKVASTEDQTPLALNERVEIEGRLGKVISRIPSVYGMVLGVRFDDGSTDEYIEDEVRRSTEQPMRFDTPIDQVKSDWDKYQELPSYTLEQITGKSRLARSLNVTAKALVTDQRTSLSDQVLLDSIVISTGTDILDMKDQTERLTVDENYAENMPQYSIPSEIVGGSEFIQSDASWIALAAEDTSEYHSNFNWDSHLAAEALKATAPLDTEQLESDEFIEAVAGFREDAMPVGYNQELSLRFRDLLEEARKERLSERSAAKLARTASVTEELTDFNEAQLYL